MRRHLLWRLLALIPTVLTASVLVFTVMRVLPGDPVLTTLSGSVHTLEIRESLRAELGLDDPPAIQYLQWLRSVASGQFGGRSLETREAIGSLLARQLPVTLLLALYTLLLSVLVAGTLGVAAAVWRDRWPDALIRLLALGGSSIPMVLLSLLAIVVLLRLFGWSPPVIYAAPFDDPRTHAEIMLWPTLLLSWEFGSHLVRVVRAGMIEELSSDHVIAARSKGLPERAILLRHALRGALAQPVETLGLRFGTLLGGALVVETVFGLPGIGRGLVRAALARDYPVVQTVVTLLVLIHLVVNLAVDAAHRRFDPRLSQAA